jgi:hypothetical protein
VKSPDEALQIDGLTQATLHQNKIAKKIAADKDMILQELSRDKSWTGIGKN